MKKNKNRFATFAVLFASATAIIHIGNKIIAASASLKEMLDSNRRNYYKWRFGEIFYTKKGSGSPVLLIHDMLPGGSGYEWTNVEEELAMEHTVYTIDLLGCGRSEKPGMTYTNFVYVQVICDFIKNVIGEKTDVIASGFSGSFAVMACRNEGSLFNRIMLVNPPAPGNLTQMPSKKDKLLKYFLEVPVFGTLVYHMIVSRENINNLFIENMFFDPFHPDQNMLDAYYEAAHKGGAQAKAAYASKASRFMNINILPALKNIDNSIFIIEGEAENNGDEVIAAYQEANPSIEAVMIPHTKHLPHVEDPEKFLEQAGIFL
ncbi:MAG: alpha/beta fold hydrolase [Blautia sp.]|uniref:alpha/beta fold hydrolase n=1 Tax=Blautia sp. TaxID=1955243 RepID=UPI002E77DFB7|nr:alpha/beta fold hydrolase [Blautia sp.]MED9881666.1 alpha/beta fold hydrolase [Blautia sp.]